MIETTNNKSTHSRIFTNPLTDDVFFSFGRCVSILGLLFFLADISFPICSQKYEKTVDVG